MEIIIYLFIFYFAAIWGSFLNMLIYRLPLDLSVIRPRSFCPHCKKTIPWYCNIPIFSYLSLKGKCVYCKASIPLRYLLVEILTSSLGVFLFFLFKYHGQPTVINLDYTSSQFLIWLFAFCVGCILIAHFFIDLSHKILPDSLNILLAIILLLLALIYSHNSSSILIGGTIGLFFPLAITWGYYQLRGQIGLGGGDIKLWGAMGLFLGPYFILENIFLSCALGSFFALFLMSIKKMNKDDPLPFGPFIIIVFFIQFLGKLFPGTIFSFSVLGN